MLALRKKEKTQADIPTSSMADIAFLLLVFFLTTTTFANKRGLQLKLPEKGLEIKIAQRNIMQILVSPQGDILVVGQDGIPRGYTVDTLKYLVADELERTNDSVTVTIKVARTAPYREMINVLDEVKQANAKRISLQPVEELFGGGGGQ